jgi:hypothetical protein
MRKRLMARAYSPAGISILLLIVMIGIDPLHENFAEWRNITKVHLSVISTDFMLTSSVNLISFVREVRRL